MALENNKKVESLEKLAELLEERLKKLQKEEELLNVLAESIGTLLIEAPRLVAGIYGSAEFLGNVLLRAAEVSKYVEEVEEELKETKTELQSCRSIGGEDA